jgi:hypothetical protein
MIAALQKRVKEQAAVLPLDMVDNSINPLRTHFRPIFSSLDCTDRFSVSPYRPICMLPPS